MKDVMFWKKYHDFSDKYLTSLHLEVVWNVIYDLELKPVTGIRLENDGIVS